MPANLFFRSRFAVFVFFALFGGVNVVAANFTPRTCGYVVNREKVTDIAGHFDPHVKPGLASRLQRLFDGVPNFGQMVTNVEGPLPLRSDDALLVRLSLKNGLSVNMTLTLASSVRLTELIGPAGTIVARPDSIFRAVEQKIPRNIREQTRWDIAVDKSGIGMWINTRSGDLNPPSHLFGRILDTLNQVAVDKVTVPEADPAVLINRFPGRVPAWLQTLLFRSAAFRTFGKKVLGITTKDGSQDMGFEILLKNGLLVNVLVTSPLYAVQFSNLRRVSGSITDGSNVYSPLPPGQPAMIMIQILRTFPPQNQKLGNPMTIKLGDLPNQLWIRPNQRDMNDQILMAFDQILNLLGRVIL